MDLMFRKGWFRITRYADQVYCHNSVKKPSDKQLKILRDHAIEQGMRYIRWDNEDDDIVLWASEEY